MPYIEFKTNCPLSDEKKALLKSKTAALLADSFPGKTENWLMVAFCPVDALYFSGSDAPAMMIDVSIFGQQKAAGYDRMTAALCALATAECGLPADRVYVKYTEYEHWGWNGSNF